MPSMKEMQPSFIDPATIKPKMIQCIRVDGASDEDPRQAG